MTSVLRDRIVGISLLAFAVAWIVAAELAIPNGYSGSFFGPRAFPVGLGALLALLALLMIAGTLGGHRNMAEAVPEDAGADSDVSIGEEVWAAGATFGFLVAYLVAMQVAGFVLSTIVMVAGFLFFVLGKRSPVLVGGMSIGLGIGIWYVMGTLLGVYLPDGMLGLGF